MKTTEAFANKTANLIAQYRKEQHELNQRGLYHDAEFMDVLIDGALEELAEYRREH